MIRLTSLAISASLAIFALFSAVSCAAAKDWPQAEGELFFATPTVPVAVQDIYVRCMDTRLALVMTMTDGSTKIARLPTVC